jgi:hypothetical protein
MGLTATWPGSQQKKPKLKVYMIQVVFAHAGKLVTEVLQSFSSKVSLVTAEGIGATYGKGNNMR